MQVVDAVELIGKYLAALEQVAQIGAGVVAAGVAAAPLIHRPLILPVATVFYNKSAA